VERPRKIVPPVYFLATLIVMVALHFHWPLARVLTPPATYFGVLPIALGLFMGSSAVWAFRAARTPVVPFVRSTALVTTGFYRVTRNPMYFALALVLLGAALLLGSLAPWLPIPVFLLIIDRRFIRGEERFLEEIFGDAYRDYCRRVRRWL
jgi:protein-S-isoprenylcysteine O-methyltransferase Ste14